MAVRLAAMAIGCLSLVWAAIGLYIVRLALQPRGEPDDAAILFVPILVAAVLGASLSVRTLIARCGVLALGAFAAGLAAVTALNSVIVPFADYGPWTTADSVSWAFGLANAAILAVAGWTLCRRPA